MKKVSKVIFKDFRAFEGEKVFNLQDNTGKSASFVCIYGQNGMGKSSFFDGIEWVYTGEIDRMKTDIKSRVDSYKGYILKNLNSNGDEVSVQIDYDNEEMIKRVIKKGRYNNDYHTGCLDDNSVIDSGMIGQILPHNKIDNFVYAKSPQDKFEEWGKFWDKNGVERKFFSQLLTLLKLNTNKVKQLNKEKAAKQGEVIALEINSSTIKDLNKKIYEYNQLCWKKNRISKIKSVERTWIFPDIDAISDIHKELVEIKGNVNLLIMKANYLEKKYKVINKANEEIGYLKKNRSRWEKVYNNCKQKAQYIALVAELELRRKENDVKSEEIGKLYWASENWYKQYVLNKEINNQIIVIKEQVQLAEVMYSASVEKCDGIRRRIQEFQSKIDNLSNQCNQLIKNAEQYEKLSKSILEDNKSIQDEANNRFEFENKISDLDNIVHLLKGFNVEDEPIVVLDNLATVYCEDNNIMSFISDFKRDITYIKGNMDKQKECIRQKEIRYAEEKKSLTKYEDILLNIKTYIKEEKLNICPICKHSYTDNEELLKRIDSLERKDYLHKILGELNDEKKKLQTLDEEKCNRIKKWNLDCSIQKKIKIDEINKIKQNDNIANDIQNKLQKQIVNYQSEQKMIEDGMEKIGINTESITVLAVSKWISDKRTFYSDEISKLRSELSKEEDNKNKLHSSIEKQKEGMNELINNYNLFIKKEENQKLIDILKKYSEITSWFDITEMFNNINANGKNIVNEIVTYNLEIDRYSYIDQLRQEEYKEKIQDLDEKIDEINNIVNERKYIDYMEELFHNKTVSLNSILSKKRNLSKKSNIVSEKIRILEDILNSKETITEYIHQYSRVVNELEELSKIKDKHQKLQDVLTEILSKTKARMEDNISKVLSNRTVVQIYQKIEPHKTFDSLAYEVKFNGDNRPELYIKGEDSSHGQCMLPELFYSSAQLNTIALSMFLGEALSSSSGVQTIFIDDPVGHFDDINVLAFVDLIRAIVSMNKWQIVMSTHDETLFELLKNKISDKYYSAKFIKFSGVGTLESMDNY